MKQILSAWKSSFMTEPLVLLLASVLFCISLNRRSAEPVLRFFPFYFGLFFIHQLHLTLLRLLGESDSATGYWLIFSRFFTYFFILTEFWLFRGSVTNLSKAIRCGVFAAIASCLPSAL